MPQLRPSRCLLLSSVPRSLLLSAALAANACSGSQQAPPEQPSTAREQDEADADEEAIAMNEEAPCSAESRVGTYTIEFQTFSSTCPAMESYDEAWTGGGHQRGAQSALGPVAEGRDGGHDLLRRRGGAPPVDPSCKLDVPDKWSKDKCTFERAMTCKKEDGGTIRTAYTSKQKHPTGALLTGMVSVRRYDKKDEPICQGTYSFMATRQ